MHHEEGLTQSFLIFYNLLDVPLSEGMASEPF